MVVSEKFTFTIIETKMDLFTERSRLGIRLLKDIKEEKINLFTEVLLLILLRGL